MKEKSNVNEVGEVHQIPVGVAVNSKVTEGDADSATAADSLDHAHRAHAILSASSAKRWLHCPPSVRLSEQMPEEKESVYAAEGTAMHELCEYKVRTALGQIVPKPESEFYTDETDQVTDVYYEFVMSTIEALRTSGWEPLILIEERLDFSHVAPAGFGTGDMVLVGKLQDGRGVIHVIDFKGGAGVFVDAEWNDQMLLYALGALHGFDYLLPIDVVRMSIVQPRMDNVSTFECSRRELEAWGEKTKPIAQMAYDGAGELNAGDWCRFCRAKPICRACADEAMRLAQDEFIDLDAPPNGISLDQLAAMLPTLNRISSWIDSVFAYVSAEAIQNGKSVPGYKVVEGRSKRVFTDTDDVVTALQKDGYTDADIYKTELKTLTELEKLLGKKHFAEILGDYISKPKGKLAMVPEDDPRPAVEMGVAEFDVLE